MHIKVSGFRVIASAFLPSWPRFGPPVGVSFFVLLEFFGHPEGPSRFPGCKEGEANRIL